MIRSGRDITQYFPARALETEVVARAQRYDMARIAFPRRWSDLIKSGPAWNWEANRIGPSPPRKVQPRVIRPITA